jgi:hypothetical protein
VTRRAVLLRLICCDGRWGDFIEDAQATVGNALEGAGIGIGNVLAGDPIGGLAGSRSTEEANETLSIAQRAGDQQQPQQPGSGTENTPPVIAGTGGAPQGNPGDVGDAVDPVIVDSGGDNAPSGAQHRSGDLEKALREAGQNLERSVDEAGKRLNGMAKEIQKNLSTIGKKPVKPSAPADAPGDNETAGAGSADTSSQSTG